MPERDGRFTAEERTVIEQWRAERWTEPRCTCCGANRWAMADHLIVARLGMQQIIGPQELIPYVQFFCENCSHVVVFNAAMIGVVRDEPDAAPDGGR